MIQILAGRTRTTYRPTWK